MSAEAPRPAHDLAEPLAASFAQIMRNLVALIIRAFVHHPLLLPRFFPYCTRLSRAAQRLTRLMARIASGHAARPRSADTSGPASGAACPPQPRLPSRKAWFLHAMRDHPLRHEAHIIAGHLAQCLAQPGVSEFLAAHPAAQRILNPVRHFLGLPTTRKPRASKQRLPAQRPPEQPSTTPPPRQPRPSRPRAWRQIPADDAACHPRPLLRKKA